MAGCLVLAGICFLTGTVVANSWLPAAAISKFAFGHYGARLVNAVLAVTLMMIAHRASHLYDHSNDTVGYRLLIVESLLNVIGTVIEAWLWVTLWGLVAALGLLAFAVLMCVLRPYGLALMFLWNVAVDIVRIVRGKPARPSPPFH